MPHALTADTELVICSIETQAIHTVVLRHGNSARQEILGVVDEILRAHTDPTSAPGTALAIGLGESIGYAW